MAYNQTLQAAIRARDSRKPAVTEANAALAKAEARVQMLLVQAADTANYQPSPFKMKLVAPDFEPSTTVDLWLLLEQEDGTVAWAVGRYLGGGVFTARGVKAWALTPVVEKLMLE